jgi:hypothetical protein
MMQDKTNLLEKQQELYEKNNESNSKVYALQQQIEQLRSQASTASVEAAANPADKYVFFHIL